MQGSAVVAMWVQNNVGVHIVGNGARALCFGGRSACRMPRPSMREQLESARRVAGPRGAEGEDHRHGGWRHENITKRRNPLTLIP